MFKQLELKNFRKLTEKTVEFSDGLNGIFGPNYSGKTTTLMALAVALGGPSAARGKNLVNRTASNFSVVLEFFTADGTEYTVERTKDNAKLYKGKELIATKQTAVNSEISKILGVPVTDWLSLRFVTQKSAAAMFELGAAQLDAVISKITGVTLIAKVCTYLGEVASRESAVAEAIAPGILTEEVLTAINSELQEKEAARLELISEVELSGSVVQEKAKAVSELSSKVYYLREEITSGKKNMLIRDMLRAQETAAVVELENAKKARSTLPEDEAELRAKVTALRAAVSSVENLKADRRRNSEAVDNFTSQVARLETSISDAAAQLFSKKSLLPEGKTLADLKSALQDVTIKRATCAEGAKALKARQAEAAKAAVAAECPTCKRPFEEGDEHAALRAEQKRLAEEELPKKIVAATEELAAATAEYNQISADITAVEATSVSITRAETQIALLTDDLERTKAKLENSIATLRTATAAWDACEHREPGEEFDAAIGRLGKDAAESEADLRALVRALAEIAAAETKVEKCKNGLNDPVLQNLPESFDALEAEVVELQVRAAAGAEELKALETSIKEKQARIDLINDFIAGARARLDAHAQAYDRFTTASTRASTAKALQKYLRDHRSRYLQAAWCTILGRAGEFARAATGGAISGIRRSESGDFSFIEADSEAAAGDASGAQAAILGLAIQVAMAEAVPSNLPVLVCDEPTADMDADHSSATLLALQAVSGQSVVISHHRFDESLCNNVIEM